MQNQTQMFCQKNFEIYTKMCFNQKNPLPACERTRKIIATNAKSMTHGQLDRRECQLHDDTASQLSNLRHHPCGSLQNQSRLRVGQKYAANFAANFVANFLADFAANFAANFSSLSPQWFGGSRRGEFSSETDPWNQPLERASGRSARVGVLEANSLKIAKSLCGIPPQIANQMQDSRAVGAFGLPSTPNIVPGQCVVKMGCFRVLFSKGKCHHQEDDKISTP